jgi:hypothetical protein
MSLLARFAFTLAAIACCASAGVFAQTDDRGARPANSSVAGRVTVGEKPVRGVAVAFLPRNSYGAPLPADTPWARTDEAGRYRVTGVAAGGYRVVAFALALVMEDVSDNGWPGKSVTVDGSEEVENVNLTLRPGGVVTGRVTDAGGKPVIEANLSLEPAEGSDDRLRLLINFSQGARMTDDRGVYRFFGLPAGRYRLSVWPSSGGARQRTYYPGTREYEKAEAIEVTAGGEVTGADIKLEPPGTTFEITGRVVAEGGQPVGGMMIFPRAMRTAAGGRVQEFIGQAAMAGLGGEFRLSNLEPGRYTLTAQPDYSSTADWFGASEAFELNGNISGLELKVRPGGSISGTLVVEGQQDAAALAAFARLRVTGYIQNAGSGRPVNGRADAAGQFKLTGLSAGTAWIYVDQNVLPKGWKLARVERDGKSAGQGIQVGAGEHIAGVRLVFVYGTGVIKGQVQLQGALPEGVMLMISCDRVGEGDRRPAGVSGVDGRGRFLIEGLPGGEYELYFGFRPAPGVQVPRGFHVPPTRQHVSVTNGAETSVNLTVNLGPNN